MISKLFAIMMLMVMALCSTNTLGQSDPLIRHAMVTVDPVSDYEAFKPTPLPDRLNITWSDDPATTQTATWRTNTSVERAFGQIAKSTDGPLFTHETVYAKTRHLETNLGEAHYHTVTFEDLEPNTRYIYRVGDGMNWSEWLEFKTASEEFEPFTFAYFGDAQEDVKSQWSRVVRNAFRDGSYARFFLHAGDLVDNAHNDGEWGEWFEAQGFITGMIPVVPSTGNHEHSRQRLSDQWRYQFNLPENGPEDLLETTYYIDFQEVRIISLNTTAHLSRYAGREHDFVPEQIQRQQNEWLEEVLQNNDARWTIVTFHHPIFASQRGRDEAEIREQWRPLFEEYLVDLVLTGHDHSYNRTDHNSEVYYYERGDGTYGEDPFNVESGTVYVNSFSGSKVRNLDREDWMARAGEDIQLYHIIRVEEDEIHFETQTATGLSYDAFTIRKRDGQPNEIINRIPDVGEVLRGEDSILPETLRPWFYHERRFVNPPR